MLEALVGDTERGEPLAEEVGVTVAVLLERFGGGVELAAVELDDEVVGSVDGVDFVAGYLLVALRERQVVALEEAGEVVFEVGAGGCGAPFGREL
jgi:sulfur carrier protein ThiS